MLKCHEILYQPPQCGPDMALYDLIHAHTFCTGHLYHLMNKYYYLVAPFKICPQILVTVYIILLWTKYTNYSFTHGHVHDALSKVFAKHK